VEYFFQGMENFSTHAQGFFEAASTDGANHEFLEGDGGIRVRATVDDVHHRNGQHVGVDTTDVTVQGHVQVIGSSLGYSERYT